MKPIDFVRSFEKDFLEFSDYTSNDARTFIGCINPSKKTVILEKADISTNAKYDFQFVLLKQRNVSWDSNLLNKAYDSVRNRKSGVCTTFAYAAAHIISSGRLAEAPLIEIVAYSNHIFIIVGRNHSYNGNLRNRNYIDDISYWGDEYVVIDPWAIAMGYDIAFYTKSNFNSYPYKNMIRNLSLEMANKPPESAGNQEQDSYNNFMSAFNF
ncbi:hypothetical protein fh0823_03510 [Francisella halioticida]|uniref:hypothetical protein n=1 Tax=Francisella halioticida TaxID=549298 RepID=UPI001AFC7C3D|nr:hypothetical protein [Francisella halioticida]BCD90212.1 hypothetical protein fh0823_03510 [Francisella halioticida]